MPESDNDSSGVSYRPATPDDEPFVRSVYFDLRRPEFLPLGLPAEALEGLLAQQYEARAAHYGSYFPDAITSIVESDEGPIGYFILDEGEAFRLIDIVLTDNFRGRGIGSSLLAGLLTQADAARKDVHLMVEIYSPARRLYERNGFEANEVKGVYVVMVRPHSIEI